ncbi:MAG: exodeoxyribonuclease VII large subunit [Gemmatimonadetes bacterium]|nr:exodeoxyribonuclease VII large subunit [Gemmatimonadota bacterium]
MPPNGEGEPGGSASSEDRSTPQGPPTWSVSEVNKAVRSLLEETLPPLWVVGEVANWKRAASGHCYFTLKDETAQLRCVMWRGEAAKLPMDPEEGMKIRALGQLTLYEARGDYQLSARTLDAEEGEGLWKLAFERLKKKLDEEGLLLPERKRPLPRFPQTVGVVTSLTGAALHDILTVLRRRAPWLQVLLRGARVQGDGASAEIAHALRILGGSGLVDVLIVGRGGGSLEDLWAFNEEPVARAIAECPVPVISAVGHEVDVTISDLVSDFRAPTPSAGAEAVAPDMEELLRYLHGASGRLGRGLRRTVEGPRRAFTEAGRRLGRAGSELVPPKRKRLADAHGEMSRRFRDLLQNRRYSLVRLGEKMNALSPLSTLKRGYAVPLTDEGTVLRTSSDFVVGETFQLRILDGRVRAETKDVQPEEVDREE